MSPETALMSTEAQAALIEQVVLGGDLAKLTPRQRLDYYRAVCQSAGLNPLTKPFDYLTLNGKMVLYANKTCTDQLRAVHKLNIAISGRDVLDEVYVVTARGTLPDGRTDESTGAVSVGGLKGEAKANAFMKAETKAKRRLTLSMSGLGMLDETEVETIPDARRVYVDPATGEIREPLAAESAPKADAKGAAKVHPLLASGFPKSLLATIIQWVGGGAAPKAWTPEQNQAAHALNGTLLRARSVGIPVDELVDIVGAYADRPEAQAQDVAACVAQVDAMINDLTAAAATEPTAEEGVPV